MKFQSQIRHPVRGKKVQVAATVQREIIKGSFRVPLTKIFHFHSILMSEKSQAATADTPKRKFSIKTTPGNSTTTKKNHEKHGDQLSNISYE